MGINLLTEVLSEGIKDTYAAEWQFSKFLSLIKLMSKSNPLLLILENQFSETQNQIKRLKNILLILDSEYDNKICEGMKGLICEAKDLINQIKDRNVLDAALIYSVQKMVHYMICASGSLETFSNLLKLHEVSDLIRENLNELSASEEELNRIAKYDVNIDALYSKQDNGSSLNYTVN